MNLIDLNQLTASPVVRPSAQTATVTSAAFDLQPFEGTLKLTQEVGAVTGTAPTLDGKIQHCATSGGSYTDVTGLTVPQVTASNGSASLQIDTRACLRFIKYVGTIAGTTPSFTMAVEIIGAPKRLGSL